MTAYKLDHNKVAAEYFYKPTVWFDKHFLKMFDYNTKLNRAQNNHLRN